MKKLLLAAIFCLVCLSAHAQTHTFPATDTNNIFSGTNTFQGVTTVNLVSYTIATLPSPATIPVGTIATVTDALTSGSCIAGSGIQLALCRNDGSAWDSLGGGGGGTQVYPPAGIAVSNGSAWAAAATSATIAALWSGGCSSANYLRGDGTCQVPSGAGDVNSSGTPTNGQLAQWTNASTIQGVTTLPTTAVPAFTGDMTNSAGSLATTVSKINNTSLAGLATGILKNTTATGVPSIATSTDVIALWTGTCNSGTFLRADGSCQAIAGAGTVTSIGLVGTANQITITGSSPITSSGSWTLSIPNNPTLPGTTTGTFSGNLTGNVTGNASTATTAAAWTTARNLAGNSVNGSANVAFANKFIVQGTTDAGLSAAQFLGALGTGVLKNTTTTGILSIAASADIYGLWSGSCSSSTFLRGDGSCQTPPGSGSGTQYGVAYWATSSTIGNTTPPTTNGQYACGYTVTGSAALAPTCPQVGLGARGVSGTTDTILYSDNNNVVVYEGSSAVATTLPTPTTLVNTTFFTVLSNKTTATVTVTPTTWTVNGGATLAITAGQQCSLSVDPITATNWLSNCNFNPAVPGAIGATTAAAITGTTITGTALVASSDGVHNGILGLICNTTNPALSSNTVSILGCTAASNTAWGFTLPTAEPGAACTVQLGAASSHISAMSCSANITGTTYLTTTNCAANGTAANPSVVSCSAAAAGMFSCSTSASTATCQVNTTAVTANSEIMITADSSDGGASQLNVTCNTTAGTPATKPILLSKSAGASFTINVGTISVNPACFEYHIIN